MGKKDYDIYIYTYVHKSRYLITYIYTYIIHIIIMNIYKSPIIIALMRTSLPHPNHAPTPPPLSTTGGGNTEARRSEHMLSGMPSTWNPTGEEVQRGKFTQLRCIGGHIYVYIYIQIYIYIRDRGWRHVVWLAYFVSVWSILKSWRQ